MAAKDKPAAGYRGTVEGPGDIYCVAGSLTITRAASTARELDSLADPLTIDLSKVEKMDTVGAWIIYRTVRDRAAKVVGASQEEQSLLDQVAEADHPAKVRPDTRGGLPFRKVARYLHDLALSCRSERAKTANHLVRESCVRLSGW